jgi:DNA-binding beta-propeller fold protein YncE
MVKLTDLPVCDMPHGVKVNRAGTTAWVSCMDSDELVEIDITTFTLGRRIRIGAGQHSMGGADHVDQARPARPGPSTPPGTGDLGTDRACGGTFVSVSPDDARLYVACNIGNTLQIRDARTLALIREVAVGAGAYNAEPSPDGTLVVVTNKKDQSVSLVDARTLAEVARLKTTKKIVHGVAFSPDSRYAYVTQESIGSDPGAVDVIDLTSRKVVSSVPVPAQPTGLTVYLR